MSFISIPDARLEIHRTAPQFIAAYPAIDETPCLICLDHDLFVDSPSDPDPGDGRDVSDFLIAQSANCPALIHSTNAPAADSMMFSMREAGWVVDRIAPIGNDWIEAYWFSEAIAMIAKSSSQNRENDG